MNLDPRKFFIGLMDCSSILLRPGSRSTSPTSAGTGEAGGMSGVRGTVLLSATNGSHDIGLEEAMSVDDYYEEPQPMNDDDGFRRKHGTRFVHGRIYGYDVKLDQEFHNEYSEDGELRRRSGRSRRWHRHRGLTWPPPGPRPAAESA